MSIKMKQKEKETLSILMVRFHLSLVAFKSSLVKI